MAVVDYNYKAYVLKEHKDLLDKYKKASLWEYSKHLFYEQGIVNYTLKRGCECDLNTLTCLCHEQGLTKEFKECIKISRANNVRSSRLRSRIEDMLLNGACVFITLTFNDETLLGTSPLERRKMVTRYLKQYNAKYVANIDFGGKNGREHYHAVLNVDTVAFDKWRKHGAIKVLRVRNNDIETNKTRLAKYVAKLSNHAIKETARRSSLIYSR